MNLRENISLAVAGLIANKMRALLTMLGIIIGIGSVIAISSVGNAMTNSVSSMWEQMGVNNIGVQVYPRDPSGGWYYSPEDAFTDEILDVFQGRYQDKIVGIAVENGVGGGSITKRHETYKVNISGVNDGYASGATGTQITMDKGRFINEADMQRGKYTAVIAQSLAEQLFPAGANPIGQDISVDTSNYGRLSFRITGTYEDSSNSLMMGTAGTTTTMYIPINTTYDIENVTPYGYFSFYVAAKPGIDYQGFAEEIREFFDEKFFANNEKNHCYTQSLESMVNEAKGQLGMMSTAISVIAAISLLVGGIGVMNIMLVSVTERTREIGIRKALGAPNSAIRVQFIVESVIICAIGGILGILVGSGLAALGGMLLKQTAAPSVQTILIAVGFSMMIGVFFGYYPANKAAKLDPIEALRYE